MSHETSAVNMPGELVKRIEKFSKFVTKMIAGNDPNFHALYGHREVAGRMRVTGRQATSFVKPGFDPDVKLSIRQNPDSPLGTPAPYVPAELVAFSVDDRNASYFDKPVLVVATMTGAGELFDHHEKPVENEGQLQIVSHMTQAILESLRMPTPADVFPGFKTALSPGDLIIANIFEAVS